MLVYFGLTATAPVHEHISFARVTVHVAKKDNLVFLVTGSHQLFCVVNGGVQNAGRIRPSSIQISPSQIAPIVTYNDPIWIQHRNYLKNEGFSKNLGLFIILLKQKFDSSMDHKLRIALPWVHSRCQHNNLLVIAWLTLWFSILFPLKCLFIFCLFSINPLFTHSQRGFLW